MSANFLLANNPCWIDASPGSVAAMGSGAYTIAILCRPTTGNNDFGIFTGMAAGSRIRTLLEASLHLFGENDFSSGDATTLVQGNWYVAAQSKPSGPAPFTHHLWLYDPSGAGVMTHAVSTGDPGNHGDGPALDNLRVGNTGVAGNGFVAVVALWHSELTPVQLNTLRSPNLTAWANLAPDELITFENWNGATGWNTRLGTSAQTAVNGTVGVGTEPPDFDFDLIASIDLVPASFTFTANPVTPLVPATVNLSPASFALSANPVTPHIPSAVGLNIEWCVDLAPNWDAELDHNWAAGLVPNWSAALVEECV